MKNVVFDLGAVLLSWEPVSLVHAVVAPHTPTAEAAHALVRDMFHHEDWLGFDRGTHSLEDAIGNAPLVKRKGWAPGWLTTSSQPNPGLVEWEAIEDVEDAVFAAGSWKGE